MPPSPLQMRPLDWGLLIGLSILWGGSFFFVQIAVPHLPAMTIVLARVGIAALVLGVVLRIRAIPLPKGWAVWRALAVMGLLNNALPFSLFVLAQGQIGSALASILNATTPLFTLIVAHLATRDEKLGLAKGLGLLIGFGGVIVMMGGAAVSGSPEAVLAQGACLMAAVCYAAASVWGRRFRTLGITSFQTAFGMLASSTLLLVPLVAVVDQPWTLDWPGWGPVAALGALALFSTALAYQIYFRLLATAGAVNLALVTFLIPVSAIGLAIVILGETLLPRHIAGFALIVSGLWAIGGQFGRKR